jgi:uncharacterized membrane protein YkoI
MKRHLVTLALGAVAAGGVAAIAVGPALAAQAATPAPQATAPATTSKAADRAERGGGSGETALAADVAAGVKAAALAAVPGGTVDRTSSENDGVTGAVYEAHVTKADGSRVKLQFDSAYAVVNTETEPAGGDHGHGRGAGPGHGRGGSGEAALATDVAAKVKAAALAAVPGGTVERTSAEKDGPTGAVYEAHVTKADGTHVEVLLNSTFGVVTTRTR